MESNKNKKPGFITSIKTGRGITGTALQRYQEISIQWIDKLKYSKARTIELNVQFDEDTVWLTQEQMELLFQTTKQNVSLHIKNIFEEGELTDVSTVKESLTVRKKEVGKYKEKYNTTTSMSLFQLVTVSNQNEAHSFANGIAL